jgi:hypothetical protein
MRIDISSTITISWLQLRRGLLDPPLHGGGPSPWKAVSMVLRLDRPGNGEGVIRQAHPSTSAMRPKVHEGDNAEPALERPGERPPVTAAKGHEIA